MSTEPNHSSQASANAGAIKALDGGSIHKITSGQVVVDLQTAVKELVENSLDAGATTVGMSSSKGPESAHSAHMLPEVRFKDYGLELFEVIDNGSGIPPDDYPSVGEPALTITLAVPLLISRNLPSSSQTSHF